MVGYRGEDDDLPTVYIGQGDGTKGRIDQHVAQKVFWDRAIAFASTSGGLNRANHVVGVRSGPTTPNAKALSMAAAALHQNTTATIPAA